jgi:hypothetical protein
MPILPYASYHSLPLDKACDGLQECLPPHPLQRTHLSLLRRCPPCLEVETKTTPGWLQSQPPVGHSHMHMPHIH